MPTEVPLLQRQELDQLVLQHLTLVSPRAAAAYAADLGAGASGSAPGSAPDADALYRLVRRLLVSFGRQSGDARAGRVLLEQAGPPGSGIGARGGGRLFSWLVAATQARVPLPPALGAAQLRALRAVSPLRAGAPGVRCGVPFFEKLYRVAGHQFPQAEASQECHVFCCMYDRTGRFLATGADNGRVKIWTTNGRGEGVWLVNSFALPSFVVDLAFTADNRSLVAADARSLSVYEWRSQRLEPLTLRLQFCPRENFRETLCVRASPSRDALLCNTVLVGSTEGFLHVFRWRELEGAPSRGHASDRTDAQTLFSAHEMGVSGETPDRPVWRELWTVRHFLYKKDKVDAVAFHPRGTRFVHGGTDGYVYMYALVPVSQGDGRAGGAVLRSSARGEPSTRPDFRQLPSNQVVLTHYRYYGRPEWSLAPRLLARIDAHRGAITALRFSDDGSTLVTEATDGTLKVWRDGVEGHLVPHAELGHVRVGRPLPLRSGDGEPLSFVMRLTAALPGAPASALCRVRLPADAEHQEENEVERGRVFSKSCFAMNETLIVAATLDHALCVFSAASGQLLRTLVGSAATGGAHERCISVLQPHPVFPQWVLAAGWDGHATLWDVLSGEALQSWTVGGLVLDGRWHPGGRQLALSTSRGRLALFETAPVDAGDGHRRAFAPDVDREAALSDALGVVTLRYSRAVAAVDADTTVSRRDIELAHDRHAARVARALRGCPESQFLCGELRTAEVSDGAAAAAQVAAAAEAQGRRRPRGAALANTATVAAPLLGTLVDTEPAHPMALCSASGLVYGAAVQERRRNVLERVLGSSDTATHTDSANSLEELGNLLPKYAAFREMADEKTERGRRRRFLPEPPTEGIQTSPEMTQLLEEAEAARNWMAIMTPTAPLVQDDPESDPDFTESGASSASSVSSSSSEDGSASRSGSDADEAEDADASRPRRTLSRTPAAAETAHVRDDAAASPRPPHEAAFVPPPRTMPERWMTQTSSAAFPYVPQRGDIVAVSMAGLHQFQRFFALSDAERELVPVNPQVLSGVRTAAVPASRPVLFGAIHRVEYQVARLPDGLRMPPATRRAYDELADVAGFAQRHVRVRVELLVLEDPADQDAVVPQDVARLTPVPAAGPSGGSEPLLTSIGALTTFRRLRVALHYHETAPTYQFIIPLNNYLRGMQLAARPDAFVAGAAVFEPAMAGGRASAVAGNCIVRQRHGDETSPDLWHAFETERAAPGDIVTLQRSTRSHQAPLSLTTRCPWQLLVSPHVAAEPAGQLGQLQVRRLLRLVRDFGARRDLAVFVDPVDYDDFPDYLQVVAHPMCLSLLQARLEHEYYRSLDAVAADADLIVRNAKRYNSPDSAIYRAADRQLALLVDAISHAAPRAFPAAPRARPEEPVDVECAAPSDVDQRDDAPGQNPIPTPGEFSGESESESAKSKQESSYSDSDGSRRSSSPESDSASASFQSSDSASESSESSEAQETDSDDSDDSDAQRPARRRHSARVTTAAAKRKARRGLSGRAAPQRKRARSLATPRAQPRRRRRAF